MKTAEQFYALLDRDGTIIKDRHYLFDPDQIEFASGAVEGLKELSRLGFGLVIISNQSGVGRGLFDISCVDLVHKRLTELLQSEGVCVDGIYCCPHKPEDECECRKPRAGLVNLAASELRFNPKKSVVIGDRYCDIQLGRNLGVPAILVLTGCGKQELADGLVAPDFVAKDLLEAARIAEHILVGERPMAHETDKALEPSYRRRQ